MSLLLEVESLKKYFKEEKMAMETGGVVRAVDDVSFSLGHGEILAVVGESGSGKTTLAKCLSGLEAPDSGKILLNGIPPDYSDPAARRKVQYIFQDTFDSLDPRMKIFDILAEPVRLHFNGDKARVKMDVIRALGWIGMSPNMFEKYPHELSGGQRQRIGIARALTMRPSLLIADEPVSSLDVSIQAQILKLFSELNARGISIIFITHDLRVVKNLADRVLVMNRGKIIEAGEVDNIYKKPREKYTKSLLSSIPNSPYKFKGI